MDTITSILLLANTRQCYRESFSWSAHLPHSKAHNLDLITNVKQRLRERERGRDREREVHGPIGALPRNSQLSIAPSHGRKFRSCGLCVRVSVLERNIADSSGRRIVAITLRSEFHISFTSKAENPSRSHKTPIESCNTLQPFLASSPKTQKSPQTSRPP